LPQHVCPPAWECLGMRCNGREEVARLDGAPEPAARLPSVRHDCPGGVKRVVHRRAPRARAVRAMRVSGGQCRRPAPSLSRQMLVPLLRVNTRESATSCALAGSCKKWRPVAGMRFEGGRYERRGSARWGIRTSSGTAARRCREIHAPRGTSAMLQASGAGTTCSEACMFQQAGDPQQTREREGGMRARHAARGQVPVAGVRCPGEGMRVVARGAQASCRQVACVLPAGLCNVQCVVRCQSACRRFATTVSHEVGAVCEAGKGSRCGMAWW